jgi:hypothetical protein
MKKTKPLICGPERHDFHESALIGFEISRDLRTISVELEIGYGSFREQLWRLTFSQVLRFEFETIGLGLAGAQPVQVYDVYRVKESEQIKHWEDRLVASGISQSEAKVLHIVLASGDVRGLHPRSEGLEIICRRVEVQAM